MGRSAERAGLVDMRVKVASLRHIVGRFQLLLGLLIGLIFVQYALGAEIPTTVFLAIAAAIAATCNKNEVIAFFICCIPLHEMLSLTSTLAICSAIYLIRISGKFKLNLAAVCLVLMMMVWEFLHCVGAGFSIASFAYRFMPLIVLVLFMSTNASRIDYGFVVRSFAITASCTCLILLSILLIEAEFDIRAAFASFQRLGMVLEESTAERVSLVNPNTLGIICVLASAGLIQLTIAGRGKRSDLAIVMILLSFGVMTLSRTFLACLALAVVLLLLSAKGGIGGKAKFTLLIVVLMLLSISLLYLLAPELLNSFLSRFQEKDLTTGRADTMVAYHNFIISRSNVAFFGIGLQDLHEKLLLRYAVAPYVPHNGIQEIIIVWGIPGLLLVCVLLGLMVRCSRRFNKKQGLINFIPLLIILLKIQAGQMITSPYTILALSFAYLSLCCPFLIRRTYGELD